MPIGNLTSQIFANIYLNELDRFVVHKLKPKAYVRYGDDFIIITDSRQQAVEFRKQIIKFLNDELRLNINPKHDEIRKVSNGLKFIGVEIFSTGRRLNKRNRERVFWRVNRSNVASYSSLLASHEKPIKSELLHWKML